MSETGVLSELGWIVQQDGSRRATITSVASVLKGYGWTFETADDVVASQWPAPQMRGTWR